MSKFVIVFSSNIDNARLTNVCVIVIIIINIIIQCKVRSDEVISRFAYNNVLLYRKVG